MYIEGLQTPIILFEIPCLPGNLALLPYSIAPHAPCPTCFHVNSDEAPSFRLTRTIAIVRYILSHPLLLASTCHSFGPAIEPLVHSLVFVCLDFKTMLSCSLCILRKETPDLLSLSRRNLAAWSPKWKEKAPRPTKKRPTAAQTHLEKLKEKARKRETILQRKMKDNQALSFSGVEQQPKEFVPPALLLPTGSPHAFVSKLAAQDAGIEPREIFPPSEMERLPPLFRENTFVYDGVEVFGGGEGGGGAAATTTTGGDRQLDEVPKVAFLGRSNVGKSSLVNALMRRDLARCSKQPGRTQQVHRFALVPPPSSGNNNGAPLGMFLDLPGYGYAVAPDDALENWQKDTQRVLKRENRKGNLRRLFLLIDSRQGITDMDRTVLQWAEEVGQIPHTIVFTKADAVSKPKLIKNINQACLWYQKQVFVASENEDVDECWTSPFVHATSTKGQAGQGLTELLSAIEVEFLLEG